MTREFTDEVLGAVAQLLRQTDIYAELLNGSVCVHRFYEHYVKLEVSSAGHGCLVVYDGRDPCGGPPCFELADPECVEKLAEWFHSTPPF